MSTEEDNFKTNRVLLFGEVLILKPKEEEENRETKSEKMVSSWLCRRFLVEGFSFLTE